MNPPAALSSSSDSLRSRNAPDTALIRRRNQWWLRFWTSGAAMVFLSLLAGYCYWQVPDLSRISSILWLIGIAALVALEVMVVAIAQFLRLRHLGSREMAEKRPLSGDSVLIIPSALHEAA